MQKQNWKKSLARCAGAWRWPEPEEAKRFRRMAPATLAAALDQPLAAVLHWQALGCPVNADGTYSLAAVAQWRESQSVGLAVRTIIGAMNHG